jgi:hypothetical protein
MKILHSGLISNRMLNYEVCITLYCNALNLLQLLKKSFEVTEH